MKYLLFTLVLLNGNDFLSAQSNYGMEICEQDLLVNGRMNINVDSNSVYIGFESGLNINKNIARNNTSIGYQSGKNISIGRGNTFLGTFTGALHSIDSGNTYIGSLSGSNIRNGIANTFLGSWSGRNKTSGSDNTFIGQFSGHNNFTGNGNIFIGKGSGSNETGSNKLFIENSGISNPLIYGEFDNDLIQINGSLNITEVLNLIPQNPPSGACINNGDLIYGNDDELYLCKAMIWKQIQTN